MNTEKSRLAVIMSLITSLLALYAAVKGVLDKNLYLEVFQAGTISKFLISGSIAQDIISIPSALILASLSLIYLRAPGLRIFITIMGLTGYFFYGYGLYVLQGQYTSIYLVYLAIFGLSVYSLIYGLLSFEPEVLRHYSLPSPVRKSIGAFLLLTLLVLVPLWLVFLTGDIEKHLPRDTYAVFILDLCIVFPAFALVIKQLLQNKPFGNVFAGIALFKGFTVCLSVAFGELFQVLYGGLPPNYGGIVIFSILTLISFILIVLYLIKLKRNVTHDLNDCCINHN